MRSFILCTLHQTLWGRSNQGWWNWQSIYHEWERSQMYTQVSWENLKERKLLNDVSVDERIILKRIIKE
jgi:hypothetical protein